MRSPRSSARRQNREDARLWLSVFTPVVAWIGAQQVSFLLSPWVCATGRRWVLSAVVGSAFLATLAEGLVTWRRWRDLPAAKEDDDPPLARRRFMAAGALLLTAVFLVAILALAIPGFVHRPCD